MRAATYGPPGEEASPLPVEVIVLPLSRFLPIAGIAAGALIAGPLGIARASQPSPRSPAPKVASAGKQVVGLEIEPASAVLDGADSRQHVLLTAAFADGSRRDVTRQAALSVAPAGRAALEGGVLRPIADGPATLTASLSGMSATARVTVRGARVHRPVDFANDLVPMFTKIGCNQGACHGSASGRGGFHLSLRGFDPDFDFEQIVKDGGGHRVDAKHPVSSLVLRKPSAEVPHGGGLRLAKGSPERGLLARWLCEGMKGPDHAGEKPDHPAKATDHPAKATDHPAKATDHPAKATDHPAKATDHPAKATDHPAKATDHPAKATDHPAKAADLVVRMTALVVSPAERVLDALGASQQILATARYSDGSTRDVTDWARYLSGDDGVASVNDSGRVTAKGGGDAAIMVAYGGFVQAPRFVVPVGKTSVARAEIPPRNFIDDAVYHRLAALRIHPSALCTDPEFLRRASLDITGELPTADETIAFLRDRRPDKRARAIDRLVDSPAFVDFRSLQLADLLRVNSTYISDEGVEAYYRWIHQQVEQNVPWDRFVRRLLLARGRGYTDGAANYYRVATEPPELAEATAQTFLGIRVQCARCHNHPFERWTQTDYYALAAFFARVTRKDGPEFGENTVVLRSSGEVEHPKTHKPVPPQLLGDPVRPIPPGADRRTVLAYWLTTSSNRQFAQEAVNRVWAVMFGKGIVDPVDDMRVSNPPSNQELLDGLADRFILHRYDVKWLYRTIANSRTYQLSSIPTPTNLRDTRHFARALPRRLSAEQALDAMDAVTAVTDGFGNRPRGTMAIQLTGSQVYNDFLQIFGKPKREILCACERDMQPNLAQSLHLINSGDVDGKLARGNGWLHQRIAAGALDSDIVTELYLRALTRYPTAGEMKTALDHVRSVETPAENPTSAAAPAHAGQSAPAKLAASAPIAATVKLAVSRPAPVKAASSKPATAKKPRHAPRVDAKRAAALEDVAWAVLNSEEYLFNH